MFMREIVIKFQWVVFTTQFSSKNLQRWRPSACSGYLQQISGGRFGLLRGWGDTLGLFRIRGEGNPPLVLGDYIESFWQKVII